MDRTSLEAATTLTRRGHVLAACRDGPVGQTTIATRADCSRTTAYRATTFLEEQGLLDRTAEGYRTTTSGAAVLAGMETLLETLEAVERLEPYFAVVDAPAVVEHVSLFAESRVTVADEANPYRVTDRALECWEQSDTVRGVMAAAGSRESIVTGTKHARETDKTVEMCYPESVLETKHHLGEEYFETYLETPSVTVYVTDEVPFSFAIHDDCVTLVGHDERGIPAVLVETTARAPREWLEAQFRTCLETSVPLESR